MKLMVSASPANMDEREETLAAFEMTLRSIDALRSKVERLRPFTRRHDPTGRHHVLYEQARHAIAIARASRSRAAREGCLRQACMYRMLARAEREARVLVRQRREEVAAKRRKVPTQSGEHPILPYGEVAIVTRAYASVGAVEWHGNRYRNLR